MMSLLFSKIMLYAICALPGVYLAATKYVYTFNPKYNIFILRLFVTLPTTYLFVIVFTIFSEEIFAWLSPELYFSINSIFGEYTPCVFASIFALLILLHFKFFILINELPDFLCRAEDESPLYLYLPDHLIHETNNKHKQIIIKRGNYEVKVKELVSILTINEQDFVSNTIGLTRFGHLIASEYALEVLKENNIPFTALPVQKKNLGLSKTYTSDMKCFRLIIPDEMPPASPPTVIDMDKSRKYIILEDFKMYYSKDAIKEFSDFNRTYEYFGNDLYVAAVNNHHFQYLVVTQKVKDIFIHQLGQNEWDFKTVYLTDDDGNILKS